MDLHAIVKGLSVGEKKTLLALQKLGGKASTIDLGEQTGLEQVAVARASLGLAERGLVHVREQRRQIIGPTREGEACARDGLPERRMLIALSKHGPDSLEAITKHARLPRELAEISLGWLRRKGWAEFKKIADKRLLSITKAGEEALKQKFDDETLLKILAERKRVDVQELPGNVKSALTSLKGRKLLLVREEAQRELTLTDLGNRAVALGVELVEEVSELTRELLVSGRWREVKFRRYDVVAPGAPVYPGKIHPQQQVIDELREILLEMGFIEIKGRIVESEFHNFDILFQAQDHPAREIHDSLSLSKPQQTKLPSPDLVKQVAMAHERGVAGSTGWGYKFNTDISQRPVLCSQTTAATVRYLASHPEPPAKVYCVDRVYRHEKIDYKHLAEFYQAEGIVMDAGLTLRDMLGYLKQIVVKLGLPKIRFRPGMFPFTEPSVEADVYNERRREWIEILGAGLFRPEVLRPLGIRYPVLAWGIGLTRLITIRLGLDDIRDIFCNDINWISNFVLPPIKHEMEVK